MSAAVKVTYASSDSEGESMDETPDMSDEEEGQVDELEDDGPAVKRKKKSREPTAPGVGLANVMTMILEKQSTDRRLILSKAKTERELIKAKKEKTLDRGDDDDDIGKKSDGEDSDESDEDPEIRREQLLKKKSWEQMFRVVPKVTDREREKRLVKIATKGVVQLFNAVKKQQKQTSDELKEVGSSALKQDKVLQSVKKGSFMDMLKTKTSQKDSEKLSKNRTGVLGEKTQNDSNDESEPSWKILREDFMLGSKMKDWDKDSDSDANQEEQDLAENSDDDSDNT